MLWYCLELPGKAGNYLWVQVLLMLPARPLVYVPVLCQLESAAALKLLSPMFLALPCLALPCFLGENGRGGTPLPFSLTPPPSTFDWLFETPPSPPDRVSLAPRPTPNPPLFYGFPEHAEGDPVRHELAEVREDCLVFCLFCGGTVASLPCVCLLGLRS